MLITEMKKDKWLHNQFPSYSAVEKLHNDCMKDYKQKEMSN